MTKLSFQELKKELPGIKRKVPLAEHTTFQVGGIAEYFFISKTKNELIDAVKTANKHKLPFFILGGGSNLLVADKGFSGMVVRIKNQNGHCVNSGCGGLNIKNASQNSKTIEAHAGEQLAFLVELSLKRGLTGLEWAAGIPGTIGGAVVGNCAAFGESMSDIVQRVEAFDSKTLKIKTLNLKDCAFGDKTSLFKKKKNLIILSAEIKLKKGDKSRIGKKVKEHINYRKKNHPLEFASAGCVFKNQKQKTKNQKLFKKFPELRQFTQRESVPAGALIEGCGLKGRVIGKAQISARHANFIVNLGGAKAKDILALMSLMKKRVKEKYGLFLDEEIEYVQ